MKFIQMSLVLCLMLLCDSDVSYSQTVQAQPEKIFYIVRHAEKDTGNNPALSSLGKQRAADLREALKAVPIDRILVTPYRRTAMTGDSVRMDKNLKTSVYAADLTGAGLEKCLAGLPASENNFLIIGHSNTIPALIRKLGVKEFELEQLPEDAYDRLFILRIRKGNVVLEEKKFGTPTP